MPKLTNGLHWAWQKLRRLRALVQDEDHDPWMDDHRGPDRSTLRIDKNFWRAAGGGGGG